MWTLKCIFFNSEAKETMQGKEGILLENENGKLLMIDGGCAFMADNPDSNNIIMKEMATLVKLSDVPGKTTVGIYGNELQKDFRQGAKRRHP